MYFHCVFFHTILTVAQDIQRGNFIIFPECYSVLLVVFSPLHLPWMCFKELQGNSTESVHTIVMYTRAFVLL